MKYGLLTLFILFSLLAIGQNDFLKVKGTVVNQNNEPIPFANIILPEKHKGTISDQNGNFTFFANENDTLLFSCMGYKSTIFVLPTVNYPEVEFVIALETDTIFLKEAIVFPWRNYKEFRQAFMAAKPPKTDLDRAEDNLAMIEKQLAYLNDDPDATPSASMAYHNHMQGMYDQMYYRGQTQPISILNPIAWAQFFKALKNGDFKQKKDD